MFKTENHVLGFIKLSQTSDWNIKQIVSQVFFSSKYDKVSIGKCIKRIKNEVVVQNDTLYKRLTIKTKGGGVSVRDELLGKDIKTKNQYRVSSGQLAVSKIDARNGAFGIVPVEANGAIITGNFWAFNVDVNIVFPQFLVLLLSSDQFVQAWLECSNGSGNRLYLQEEKFLKYMIPLPSIEEQQVLLDKYNAGMKKAHQAVVVANNECNSIESFLFDSLGIIPKTNARANSILATVHFSSIAQWGYDKNVIGFPFAFAKNKAFSFNTKPSWIRELYRGKSPKYNIHSSVFILNQKCNRKNEIIIDYAKTVDDDWFRNIPKNALTQKNDIIINSTGEGTIGRASCITKSEHIGLAYDSHVLLLRVNENEVDPQLFVSIFNSSFGQAQVELYKSAQATNQTELGIENTKKFLFPLPNILEQHHIAEEIRKKEERIKALREEAESLRQCAKKEFEEAVFGAQLWERF